MSGALTLLRLQAAHNCWMNEKLYAVCARLSDEERRRDLGAFFRSVHGTLNHLLLVDRLWLGRVVGQRFAVDALDQELYAAFAVLAVERQATDTAIQDVVDGLVEARLSGPVTYTSLLTNRSVTLPLGLILTHLFHHQTHHRGQITALLSQLGYDFGDTDMIYMPGVDKYFERPAPG